MDKLKLAQLGERLKTGGAQMGRMVSGKMKEILQTPTPESKMVDEATMETLEGPNWGMNLRICALINSDEFSGLEIVRAIKKKILGKNVVSQRLSLDLLEACTTNCEKVFSAVASEKLLEEMVRMIENPQMHYGNKEMAMQLIRAWGESEELAYLPVFHQTYMSLKGRDASAPMQGGNLPAMQYPLESYVHQQSMSPPGQYPVPENGMNDRDQTIPFAYGHLSVEEMKEFLVTTRNSIELLSSILDTDTDPKPGKDDLTVTMLDNCKHSQPVMQNIIQNTTDDDAMLFEALNLHDELQQVIVRYDEMETALKPREQSENCPAEPNVAILKETNTAADSSKKENTIARYDEMETALKPREQSENCLAESNVAILNKTNTVADSAKKENTESSNGKKDE